MAELRGVVTVKVAIHYHLPPENHGDDPTKTPEAAWTVDTGNVPIEDRDAFVNLCRKQFVRLLEQSVTRIEVVEE